VKLLKRNQGEIKKKSKERDVIKPLVEDTMARESPDPQGKLDFNTIITNTLPQISINDTLPNTSYSISHKFSIPSMNATKFSSEPSMSIHNSIFGQLKSNNLNLEKKTFNTPTTIRKNPLEDIIKEERVRTGSIEVRGITSAQLEKIEISKKSADRRNTVGVPQEFTFKSWTLEVKEDLKDKLHEVIPREVDFIEVEETQNSQILVEVSQGGKLVKGEVPIFEGPEHGAGNQEREL
jgi:hypothetical protein